MTPRAEAALRRAREHWAAFAEVAERDPEAARRQTAERYREMAAEAEVVIQEEEKMEKEAKKDPAREAAEMLHEKGWVEFELEPDLDMVASLIRAAYADKMKEAEGRAIVLREIVAGRMRWESFGGGPGGELCYQGMRYCNPLDDFGCPVLTDHLDAAIDAARKGKGRK